MAGNNLKAVRDAAQRIAAALDPALRKAEALKRGLILLTCGVYGNVIRFLAPITIPDEVFAEAMDILEQSVAAAGH